VLQHQLHDGSSQSSQSSGHHGHPDSHTTLTLLTLQNKLDRAEVRKEEAERQLVERQRKVDDLERKLEDVRRAQQSSDAEQKALEGKMREATEIMTDMKGEAGRKLKKASHSVKEARAAAESALELAQRAEGKAQERAKEVADERGRREQAEAKLEAKLEEERQRPELVSTGTDAAGEPEKKRGGGEGLLKEVDPMSLASLLNETASLKRKLAMSDASKSFAERALSASQTRVKAALSVSQMSAKSMGDSSASAAANALSDEVVGSLVKEVEELQERCQAACVEAAAAQQGWKAAEGNTKRMEECVKKRGGGR
jgi:hypothetical protein